jgi:hypothetical protein
VDWYRAGPVVGLILAYYALLRSICRTQPDLRRCLTRCRHCRIFFFADPRNAKRRDLGCPFGCQQAHRRRQSNKRSTAYYQDEPGKEKKRQQNAKRRQKPAPGRAVPWPGPELLDRPILEYVRLATSLIEGRPVSLGEVLEMLAQVLRQHTMVRTRRIDQIIAWLNEHPP